MANLNRIIFIALLVIAITNCKTASPIYFAKIDRTKPTTCLKFSDLNLNKKQLHYIKRNVHTHINDAMPFSDENLCMRLFRMNNKTDIIKLTTPIGDHTGPLWFLRKGNRIEIISINFKELKSDSNSVKRTISTVLNPINGITQEDKICIEKYFLKQSNNLK